MSNSRKLRTARRRAKFAQIHSSTQLIVQPASMPAITQSPQDPRSDPPFTQEEKRELRISFGVEGLAVVAGYFIGGTFGPALIGCVCIVMILTGMFPRWFVRHVDATLTTPHRRETSYVRWVWIAVACFSAAGIFTWVYNKAAPKSPDLSEVIANKVADRIAALIPRNASSSPQKDKIASPGKLSDATYSEVVSSLDSENELVRIAAIYDLEKIANGDPRRREAIGGILTKVVRGMAVKVPPTNERHLSYKEKIAPMNDAVKAIMKVFGRRNREGETRALNLSGICLTGLDIYEGHFESAIFFGSEVDGVMDRGHFERADFRQAYIWGSLNEAHLDGAEMTSAEMFGAHARKASFKNAILVGTILNGAILTGSDFTGATIGAQFGGTDVRGANFKNADFTITVPERLRYDPETGVDRKLHNPPGKTTFKGTLVEGANFSGANLRGVDLRGMVGLTETQLKQAVIDEHTILPDGMRRSIP